MDKRMTGYIPSQATADGMKILETKRGQNIIMIGGIEYADRNGQKLFLYIVRNASDGWGVPFEKLPTIVFIQGSGWRKQNVFINLPQLVRFAARGFAIAFVEHRESEVAPFPAQVQDCKTAVRFLRKNAEQYGVDSGRISLWGDSSGGHTVLLAGITGDGLLDTDDYNKYSCKVNTIIDYYGTVDAAELAKTPWLQDHAEADSTEGMMLGGVPVLENLDKVKAANPATYVSAEKECPPVLIIHGDSDRVVPFGQSIIIYNTLKKFGKQTELYKIPGADHGTNEHWTEAAYDIVEDFINKF
jgi:acetyl esterase/lipase